MKELTDQKTDSAPESDEAADLQEARDRLQQNRARILQLIEPVAERLQQERAREAPRRT